MNVYEFEEKRPSIHREAFVHPQAVLIGHVEIGARCYVGAGAVLRGDIGYIKVGRGSNVQENCVIHTYPDRWTTIHPESHVGHACILHGCEICSNVLVGMNSIIADGVKVNSNCVVGAGSFIAFQKEIPPNSVVVGSPAKVIKKVSAKQLEDIANGRALYQELAERYLRTMRPLTSDEAVQRDC